MDMKLLSTPESNNTLARCWFRRNIPLTTFGSWHDKSLILVGASFTQGKVPSIPTIFSWGSSISPDGFLSSILMLVVIIVAVIIVVVTVILVVVVVAIIVVVVVVGGVSSIIELSFMIIGSLHRIVLC
ncbi:hypothetical protein Tco_0868219 [Tanacetum coccineum]